MRQVVSHKKQYSIYQQLQKTKAHLACCHGAASAAAKTCLLQLPLLLRLPPSLLLLLQIPQESAETYLRRLNMDMYTKTSLCLRYFFIWYAGVPFCEN